MCLQSASNLSTMSYGDYNPDEVSEKFQDNLNLDNQGGGGYGGDEYDGSLLSVFWRVSL